MNINYNEHGTNTESLISAFKYAGHDMTVIYSINAQDGFLWTVVSESAEPIEGGVYPKPFAELEASAILQEVFDSMEDEPTLLKDATDLLRFIIRLLIEDNQYDKAGE